MSIESLTASNLEALAANPYPGRGIIIGRTPNAKAEVQIYWIMGRSENSRNRVFFEEDGFLKTQVHDPSKVTDPSLIIYYPMKHLGKYHIVTNGDQTDTIYDALRVGDSFESALDSRSYEPDPPIYTPRIAGLTDVNREQGNCKLGILKTLHGNPDICVRNYFGYSSAVPGVGHCIHTYGSVKDGVVGSFDGEPYVVRIYDDIAETINFYWNMLNEDNRVSIAVKQIDTASGAFDIRIINKLG